METGQATTQQANGLDESTGSRSESLPERFASFALKTKWRARIIAALLVAPILLFAVAELPPRAHISLSLFLLAVALLTVRRYPHMRMVVIFLSVAASCRYIIWRGTSTLAWTTPGDSIASGLLFLAELYAFTTLLGGYFQTAITRRRIPVPLTGVPDEELPSVDLFIPTYNEPVIIVRRTAEAALELDYPRDRLRVYVLDDTPDPESQSDPAKAAAYERRAREIRQIEAELPGLGVIDRKAHPGEHRWKRGGAKAGNINYALSQTSGELVAIFDTDHVPVRSFLQSTVGFFLKNQKLALVQTPHHFYNPAPFERNLSTHSLVPPENHLFYHVIQPGNDFWNSSFFCGSCAVLRREALAEVGGIAQETVTEDAHTALKMHSLGWDSAYLPIPQAAGLATERLSDHVGQRIRWARGMAQIFRRDNPLFKPGLSLAQRFNYANATWHFFMGIPRLIFLLAPPMYLIFDLHPLLANVREVLIYALPHLLLAWVGATLVQRNVRHSFWPEVFETVMAPYAAVVTSMAVIMPSMGTFNVTAKGELTERRTYDWRRALPVLILLGLAVGALIATPFKMHAYPLDSDTIAIAAAWNVYNVLILCGAMLVALEQPQRRAEYRLRRRCKALARAVEVTQGRAQGRAQSAPPERWTGETLNLSYGGALLRLREDELLPERLTLSLVSAAGHHVTVESEVLEQQREESGLLARLRFLPSAEAAKRGGMTHPLSPAQHRALTLILFAGADSWVHDRFTLDQPLRAALVVFTSPWLALFNRSHLIRRLLPLRETERLITATSFLPCHACGVIPQRPSERCDACGANLHPKAAPERRAEARRTRGLGDLVTPALFLVLSFGLAANINQVVSFFETIGMPMERWTASTYQTRLAELHEAYKDLTVSYRKLQEQLNRDDQTDQEEFLAFWTDWYRDLQALRRDHALFGEASNNAETAPIERALFAAVLALNSAGQEYRDWRIGEGGEMTMTRDLLREADASLVAAARTLGLTR